MKLRIRNDLTQVTLVRMEIVEIDLVFRISTALPIRWCCWCRCWCWCWVWIRAHIFPFLFFCFIKLNQNQYSKLNLKKDCWKRNRNIWKSMFRCCCCCRFFFNHFMLVLSNPNQKRLSASHEVELSLGMLLVVSSLERIKVRRDKHVSTLV